MTIHFYGEDFLSPKLEEILRQAIFQEEQVGENLFRTYEFEDYAETRDELTNSMKTWQKVAKITKYSPREYAKLALTLPVTLIAHHYLTKYVGANIFTEGILGVLVYSMMKEPLKKFKIRNTFNKSVSKYKKAIKDLDEKYDVVA